MNNSKSSRLAVVVWGLLMLGLSNAGWAACVQDAPAADTIAVIDATTGCASVNGQVGCRIDNGTGSCTATDGAGNVLFTASSSLDALGRVNWSVDPSSAYKIDSVLVGGATQGNACGFFHSYDTEAGTGLGFQKSNGGYANVTYVDVCTDMKKEVAIAPPPVIPACPQDIQDALNDQTIEGDFAIVGKITDGDSPTLCIRQNPGITVTFCENEEGKNATGPTASGAPRCSEGPDVTGDGVPDGAEPFKRNTTFVTSKVGNSSCYYMCVPPPMTLNGVQSCAYYCY